LEDEKMATSRRDFLRQGTLGALAAGVSLAVTNKTLAREVLSSSASPLVLDRAVFQAQLKTSFLIGVSKVRIRLIEVFDLGSRQTASGKREAFTLTFRGDNGSPLRQDTYRIEHEKLGMFSLLIVPIVSRDKSARYYEAVINRLHS
jgi:hypothetical protein